MSPFEGCRALIRIAGTPETKAFLRVLLPLLASDERPPFAQDLELQSCEHFPLETIARSWCESREKRGPRKTSRSKTGNGNAFFDGFNILLVRLSKTLKLNRAEIFVQE